MKILNFKLKTLNFLSLFAFVLLVVIFHFKVSSLNLSSVSAQSLLQYPIPELGLCRDAKECFLYCEIPENKPACWSYGKFTLGRSVLGVTSDEQTHQEEMAKKYGITFPIAELGNCASVTQCRAYCENTAHHEACMNFAKTHGFYNENEENSSSTQARKQELLQYAKSELGCDSYESCRAYCETNHERCRAFAEQHGFAQKENRGNERGRQLLEKAKSELGCYPIEACRKFCEENKERCMEFMNKFTAEHRNDNSEKFQQEQSTPPRILSIETTTAK